MHTFSTAVEIIKTAAPSFVASIPDAWSLSITAFTPLNLLSLSTTTGMPPPPTAITVKPEFTRFLMASISIMLFGIGEGTTLLYPLPASMFITQPG